MMKETVKIKLFNFNTKLPVYATKGASGIDLCANLKEKMVILPFKRALIPAGIAIEMPKSDCIVEYEAQVRPRSGLALKYGITVLNSPGTIDQDYRGEIGVILYNASNEPFEVYPNDRIAQLVFTPVLKPEIVFTFDELEETYRGSGGFGSTGK